MAVDRELLVENDVNAALKRSFGFDTFRPGQERIVSDVLAGRDLLAIMPTGGGKSLCFQLPATLQPGISIVISPLIALMQDQIRLLQNNGIAATSLNSSIEPTENARRIAALLRGEYKLVYLAPERLLGSDFADTILPALHSNLGINAFVIDEAHCVSEWGHDFRPEYRQLASLRRRFSGIPMLAFTATATPRVRADIAQQLALRDPAIHVASFNRPNLHYAVLPKNKQTYRALLARARAADHTGIVYCLSRKRVDVLAAKLRDDGVRALPYHAGLEAEQRTRNQHAFIHDDAQVIVATIAFGMGINKHDVRWVVHYDLPKSLEGYYQESGRAGRDGDPAQCILYFSAADIRTAEFLIQQKVDPVAGTPLENEQRQARQQLRGVLAYADSTECRRLVQLRYFGEDFSGPCGACDNCCEPRETLDATLQARQFLSCVARLANRGERFGATYLIEVLRGGQSQRLIDRGHASLTVYGIGKQRSVPEWRNLARSLVQQGLLDETQDGYPVLLLNARSWEVLRGTRTVHISQPPGRPAVQPAIPRARSAAGDEPLFDALRALRKQLAQDSAVPPYVIFHDATLRAMAQSRPLSLQAFAALGGVGQAKLTRYAAAFIEVIRAHAAAASA